MGESKLTRVAGRDPGAGVLQNSLHSHVIPCKGQNGHGCTMTPPLKRALRHTGEGTVSRPLMSLGLTLETGPSDVLSFGKVPVVLTLINSHQREQASPGSENISQDRHANPFLPKFAWSFVNSVSLR